MPFSTAILVGIILLLAEAFFAGAEIAIVSASRTRLSALAGEGHRGAKIALDLLESPEWLHGTVLTWHNASFVTNVAIATLAAIEIAGLRYGELLSITVVIPILVIFGEIVPKSFFQERADVLAPRVAPIIWGARLLIYPVVWALSLLIRTVVGGRSAPGSHTPFVTRRELEVLVEEPSEGDVQAVERKMIGRIFSFGGLDVTDVMVPLVDVSAVGEDGTLEDVIGKIEKDGHSRIPVYRESVNHIVGVVHARDVLALGPEAAGPILARPGLVREAYFIPESKPADDLLAELQREKHELAVVVDEYGGCIGIVAVEDLVEEIVGEISDEYDLDEVRLFRRIGERKYVVDARMEIGAVREELSVPVPEGDYNTLGGFLLEKFGRIPKAEEQLVADGWIFTIEAATERSIESVRLELLPPEADDPGPEDSA
ncbi:MAG: hemolysin family protein [Nitrospinota bacterium]